MAMREMRSACPAGLIRGDHGKVRLVLVRYLGKREVTLERSPALTPRAGLEYCREMT